MDDLMHGPGGGDESGAVKPWVGAVRPPKSPPPISAQAPTLDIKLSWIHGYSCSAPSQRNNLFYNLGQKLIYPAASLAVLLDRSSGESNTPEWKQQYFKGHDDDVLCIAMSRDRRYIATGQIASKALKGKASVIVWDALQCRLLSRMESCHQRGVLSLAFNDTGSQLISVGMDDSFTHILWSDLGGSWSRVQQLSSAKGDKTPVSETLLNN
jgi:microtubule-associated protein-like 6